MFQRSIFTRSRTWIQCLIISSDNPTITSPKIKDLLLMSPFLQPSDKYQRSKINHYLSSSQRLSYNHKPEDQSLLPRSRRSYRHNLKDQRSLPLVLTSPFLSTITCPKIKYPSPSHVALSITISPKIKDQRSKTTPHLAPAPPLSFLVAEADVNRFLILSMPVIVGSSLREEEEMEEVRP